MLFEPAPTPFDLNFTLFGTHVRVHPGHWLVAAFLGADLFKAGLEFLLLWILCVFISILVHEFGHILVGRFYGSHGHIVLYTFGGLAIGSNHLHSRWQRIAVSAGGPGAGFILAAIAWALNYFSVIPILSNAHLNLMIRFALVELQWINIAWGIMNLLPIFPLDGGQISKELCEWGSPRRGFGYCLRLSLGLAVVVAIHCLLSELSNRPGSNWNYPLDFLGFGSFYTALLFASLAFGSYQMLQAHQRQNDHWDDEGWDDWHQRR